MMTEQELRDLIKGNISEAYNELANESKTQEELEVLVKDLDFNPYLNFAEEHTNNAENADEMQEFLDNISDKDAKKLIKDIKKGVYESESIEKNIAEKIEALNINEGQFSWFTQDTDRQIGSEKLNTITVYMHDNEGNSWEEKSYEGYGVFGGLDYYELLAKMNGYDGDRNIGIDIAFGKKKSKVGKKTLFPALTSGKKLKSNHDFTKQPDSDPNQSWYQEDEDYRY